MRRLTFATVCVAAVLTAATASADLFWGGGSPDWGVPGPALFQLDTATGTVGTTYVYSDWNWIMAAQYAPGNTLYVSHNTIGDEYAFKLARIDAATGAVLSDTPLSALTGTDYPQWNALEYLGGKLYGVENCSFGSGYTAGALRGYTYQVDLDVNGDPTSATLGAYVGGAPDGALAYRSGTWYASDWKTDTSSWIKKTTDIMNTDFTADVGTSPVGLIAGWDFESDGDMLGVSWYYDFNVYQIDPSTGAATALYNLGSQLPAQLTMFGALTATPEPASAVLLGLGLVAGVLLRRRHP
jgi:hypothetical protein